MSTDKNVQGAAPAGAASVPPAEPGGPASRQRRTLLLRALLLGAGVGAAVWGFWYQQEGRWQEETDNAYVQGNLVQITPQTAGTVVAIAADVGEPVRLGQTLVSLDRTNSDVALSSAMADLSSVMRKVKGLYTQERGLRSTIQAAEADVQSRRVTLDKARADYQRRKELARSGAISDEELAHARDTLSAAQSALAASQSTVASLEQQYQGSKALVDGTVVVSHPEVQKAAATLRSAYLDQMRTALIAPVAGHVAQRTVQLGQHVAPGSALMSVLPLDQVWVEANFTETQLAHIRIGQAVELRADAYGDAVSYTGRVASLGLGTGSAFSPLPVQNATGNWIKIVQRLPVRIELTDPKQLISHPLRLGLSMRATVDVHDVSGPLLVAQPRSRPGLSTDVYRKQVDAVDGLIERIVRGGRPAALPAVLGDGR
ncbi:efflux RND transporter periplasmic adaptor subunit [Roseateles flavus]|uniref:Efflux RND transporter periplasmic adaptor subunit n=1 Tax=Roseateles flavus TaxID=3149041 RepID=A0ABV0GFI2_9BURK